MKTIDATLLDELSRKAAASPRRRAHHNIHPALEDPVQRLCVAIEPGTYIRPHRHAEPPTWEVFLMLRGRAALLFFDESGRVNERFELDAKGPVRAVEIPAGAWHSIASLEAGSVFFEIKQGPYTQPNERNVASWAPPEGDAGVRMFEAWFRTATAGSTPPPA